MGDLNQQSQSFKNIHPGHKVVRKHFFLEDQVVLVDNVTDREIVLANGERYTLDGKPLGTHNTGGHIAPYTGRDRQKSFYQRQRAKGLIQPKVWIPDNQECKSEIERVAALMREGKWKSGA